MKRQKLFLFVIALATFATIALCATHASAATEQILYSFHPALHGQFPAGGLISVSAGNLYGVTANGGLYDNGAVFTLSPNSHGGWTQTVLYSFKGHISGANDGIAPNGTLTFDSAGNLFGATTSGGKSSSNTLGTIIDAGIIFKLTKTNATWKESIVWTFDQFSSTDGFNPQGGMVFDRAGNLYGTTEYGGGDIPTRCNNKLGCGTGFPPSPHEDGHCADQNLY